MLLFSRLRKVVVVAPHPDDEVLGCGGLLAKLAEEGVDLHVVYSVVDGFHHYGYAGNTTFEQRAEEIREVADLLGFTWQIIFPEQGLTEKLDTVPRRELVDLFEKVYNEHKPDFVLLPSYVDYDQDHRRTFEASFAAARPIGRDFGKWLIPAIFAYEQNKLNFAWEDLPRPTFFTDISQHIENKLEAIALYRSQLRPVPHVRSLEGVRALARIRGADIGVEYAEGFQVFRAIL